MKSNFCSDAVTRRIGRYHLPILNGHGSHATVDFDHFCKSNSIIPLYMASHSSHLLQPLDVSCFAPLKQAYGQQVQKSMQLGINHIDKQSFITLYSQQLVTTVLPYSIRKPLLEASCECLC